MNSENNTKTKKPFYKKKWFIALSLLLIVAYIYPSDNVPDSKKIESDQTNKIKKEKTDLITQEEQVKENKTHEKNNQDNIDNQKDGKSLQYATNSKNPLLNAKYEIKEITKNGNVVGKRAIMYFPMVDMKPTEEQFREFAEKVVKPLEGNVNWFTIDFTLPDKKGLVFSSCDIIGADYGTLTDDGKIDIQLGLVYKENGVYKYKKM